MHSSADADFPSDSRCTIAWPDVSTAILPACLRNGAGRALRAHGLRFPTSTNVAAARPTRNVPNHMFSPYILALPGL